MDNVSADFTINENQPLQAEYTLGESEHFDCSFELFATGTAWGLITGNLEEQTDLWNVLSSKADTETIEQNLSAIEGEISDLSDTVDNNYTTIVNRLENDELAISNNASDITSINNTIQSYGDIVTYNASSFATSAQGALADTALQSGDNISELVNNVGYITSASLPTLEDLTTQAQLDAINSGATTSKINQIASNTQAISTETENRQNADNNLQSQIDAITASSDVTDIVGTYAQLQAYDTSTLAPNSIIKVLQDEHQNNETTYYRWVITGGVGAWVLIGEEGPYYTKSEADGRFVPQTRTINGKALSNNISLDASDVGALPSSTVIPTVNNGTLDIQVNGTSVGTFTANQSGNTTANIVVPDSATWGNITGDIADQTDLQEALDEKISSKDLGDITDKVDNNYDGDWGLYVVKELDDGLYHFIYDDMDYAIELKSAGQLKKVEYFDADDGSVSLQFFHNGNDFSYSTLLTVEAANSLYLPSSYIPFKVVSTTSFSNWLNNEATNELGWYAVTDTVAKKKYLVTTDFYNVSNPTHSYRYQTYFDYDDPSTIYRRKGEKTGFYNPITWEEWKVFQSFDIIQRYIDGEINDGTLTIQVNGTSVGTFTANQSGNTTANIVVPDSATWGNITGNISNQTDLQKALNDKQDVLTAGTGIDITNNVISNTQTSAEWGNITGTLSNQTDLQNALNAKSKVTIKDWTVN